MKIICFDEWICLQLNIISIWLMNLSRDNHPQSQQQQLLEAYCKIKPSRAIDRLLTEHTLQKAYSLYHLLQENIKDNTTKLRSTLTHKYQNIVNCSNLLLSIKNFTEQIQSLERDISSAFFKREAQQCEGRRETKVILRIEELIYKKSYRQAMQLSFQQSQSMDESEIFYLPFLRIQILEQMQVAILTNHFTDSFIYDMVLCLKIFFMGLKQDQREEVIWHSTKHEGDLLCLVGDCLRRVHSDQGIEEDDIIEIIFKCKLFSLNKSMEKGMSEQLHIIKFFCDIYLILDSHQSTNHQITHLIAIFVRNLDHIEKSLFQTFIIKKHDSVSFRYQLYHQLLSSQPFTHALQQLSQLIVLVAPTHSHNTLYLNFLSLWENYYQQLILIIRRRINPLNHLNRNSSESSYPKQIRRHLCEEEFEMEGSLRQYGQQLCGFVRILGQLLLKSKQLSSKWCFKNIIDEIKGLYKQGIVDCNNQIKQYVSKALEKPSLPQLGNIVKIFLYSHSFNQIISSAHSNLPHIPNHTLESPYQLLRPFYVVFRQPSPQWSINFDYFWMKYYGLSGPKLALIKEIIVCLLQGMMEKLDQASSLQYLKAMARWRLNEQYQKARQIVVMDLPEELRSHAFMKKKIVDK